MSTIVKEARKRIREANKAINELEKVIALKKRIRDDKDLIKRETKRYRQETETPAEAIIRHMREKGKCSAYEEGTAYVDGEFIFHEFRTNTVFPGGFDNACDALDSMESVRDDIDSCGYTFSGHRKMGGTYNFSVTLKMTPALAKIYDKAIADADAESAAKV